MRVRGEYGWAGLAAYVFIWDTFAPESLSRALWRGLEHPTSRPLVVACWMWVSSHLLLKRPARILWRW